MAKVQSVRVTGQFLFSDQFIYSHRNDPAVGGP